MTTLEGVAERMKSVKNGSKPTAFNALLDDIKELHNRKQADYGRDDDPFANIRASEEFGIPAWLGAVVRANDKMSRLKTFAAKGALKNESVEDSLMDGAIYHLIALLLYREQSNVGTNP